MLEQGVRRPSDDRWKYTYEMLAALQSEIMYPPDYRRLDGVVDFHMHVGFARIDPVGQLKLASRSGMRGLVA